MRTRKQAIEPALSPEEIHEKIMVELTELERELLTNPTANKNRIIATFFDFAVERLRAGETARAKALLRDLRAAGFAEFLGGLRKT